MTAQIDSPDGNDRVHVSLGRDSVGLMVLMVIRPAPVIS